MIRRDQPAADGSPRWILIPQIVHAQLAGDLADAWQPDPSWQLIAAEVRYAARHHDDGWADWDRHPGVDPAPGIPVNFDAMRLTDALSIWQRGIELSTIHNPLAGYLTAGHFCRLLRRFDSWRTHPATRQLADQFFAKHADQMDSLLATWQPDDQLLAKRPLAEQGVSLVQLFDAVSLWFCCDERHEPWEARLPEGPAWRFEPLGAGQVSLDPWPLDRPSLTLHAAGRSIPVAHYATADELAAAPGEPIALHWQLVPKR